MNESYPGRLIIISGPSGAGKSTVVTELIQCCPLPLTLSISATTRPIRGDDRPGENYYFMKDDEFQRRVKSGEFLEYEEVFGKGHWYGTLRAPVLEGLKSGNWIILEIDVRGAEKVKLQYPDAISVFIHPGNLQVLENRLRGRATDDPQAIERRLQVAKVEMQAASKYDHVVFNKVVSETVDELCRLLISKKQSLTRT
jgi:guanylate kinase